jgi:hypothetical protein
MKRDVIERLEAIEARLAAIEEELDLFPRAEPEQTEDVEATLSEGRAERAARLAKRAQKPKRRAG